MPLILLLAGCDDGTFTIGSASGNDSTADIECEDVPPEPITGPDCYSGTLRCGDSLVATTEGGEASLHGGDYQSWYCMTGLEDEWTGRERVYTFEHPGTGDVTLSLSSPCGALRLITMAWSDTETCPYPGVSVLECDADDSTVTIWNSSVTQYAVLVDGDEDQPFSLSVTCPSSDR